MVDEIAQLKAALVELNTKCLLARDNEIRYALQRSRLEAERTEMMVKLVEAHGGQRDGAPVRLPAALPYAVSYGSVSSAVRVVDDLALRRPRCRNDASRTGCLRHPI
jgi:hypothetical protein